MAITLRNTKGSPLTHEELDANFSTLDAALVDSGEIRTLIDSDYIISKTQSTFLDSNDFDTLFAASDIDNLSDCLLYTSPSPRDLSTSRMPSSA